MNPRFCWLAPHPPPGHDTAHGPHPWPGASGTDWQCPGRPAETLDPDIAATLRIGEQRTVTGDNPFAAPERFVTDLVRLLPQGPHADGAPPEVVAQRLRHQARLYADALWSAAFLAGALYDDTNHPLTAPPEGTS